jgi:hypothetical protein
VTFIPDPAKQPATTQREDKRDHATNDPRTLKLQTGEFVYTHHSLATREQLNRIRGRAAHRAFARQFHDVTLSTRYMGSLSEDGMSVDATSTANRLEPLARAVALSDTYVSEDGTTIADVRFARGVVRHDDGSVDSDATLQVAKTRHNKRKR